MTIITTCLRLKKTKVQAFTLMERLLSLLIISGTMLVYQGLTQSLVSHSQYLARNAQDNWLLFSQQLREELRGASFQKVEGNRLYIKKQKQLLSLGQFKSHDFRKSSGTGRGYQPMLFGLSHSQIEAKENRVTITLTWKSGLERTFSYAFQENR